MTHLKTHGEFEDLEASINLNGLGRLTNFDYMFPLELERLPSDPACKVAIIKGLTDLGIELTKKAEGPESNIPANFTYLGQFADHDITRTAMRKLEQESIDKPDFGIVDPNQLANIILNERTGTNDIDSLYNTSQITADGHFVLGKLGGEGGSDTDGHDLPRDPNNFPLIGDTRNDENLVVAQTHVAFLKFHNAVMDKEKVSSDDAQKIVIQHYQNIILNDYLPRIVNPDYIEQALIYGTRFLNTKNRFFMPLEFSMAAFRLGHSMIRSNYKFNQTFKNASLTELFAFSSSNPGGPNIPPLVWKIDWTLFNSNPANQIDTAIVNPLANVPVLNINLASRNLRRGYMFNLPTGQAVADFVLADKSLILTDKEIFDSSSLAEKAILNATNFHKKSPLWYYILKEAEIRGEANKGNRLGPIGTAIVAEVFIASISISKYSILDHKGWKPTLPSATPGKFTFDDMLRYSGLL